MKSFLEVVKVTKKYQKRKVVDGVSLHVEQGKVVGLLGPNGAGKSTTFRMISGLVAPDSGEIFFEGEEVSRLPMYKRALLGIGYLPQEPSVFSRLTVRENILIILENMKLRRKERIKRLDELLDEMNLTRLEKTFAGSLSGGERRRLEVTRALATRPSFMMWDEPFAAVDPKVVEYLQKIILQLREKGIGILITDHKPLETLSITNYAYIINDGKILREGKASDLLDDRKVREVYLGDNLGKTTTELTLETDYFELLLQAQSKVEKKEYQSALAIYVNTISLNPNNPEVYTARGKCFLTLEDFVSAKHDFEKAIKLDPKHEEACRCLEELKQKLISS